MHTSTTWHRVLFVIFACAWVFVLLALGSFRPTDWPSPAIYPYHAVENLCGNAGAFVAYWTFFILGQGIFPILFFSGICITLYLFGNRVSDVWLRTIGIALLSVAFASAIHLVRPGSNDSLPEGTGGLIGISASGFLRSHCNALVTSLILACAFLVGLLLAADDLVVRVPAFVGTAISTVRSRTPQVKFSFPQFPRLPSLPRFVTRDAITGFPPVKWVKGVKSSVIDTNKRLEEDEDFKPPVLFKRDMPKGTASVNVAKQVSGGIGGSGDGGSGGGSKLKVSENVAAVQWTGQVPSAKWMTFYTKVLAKYAKEKGLTLKATFELRPKAHHGVKKHPAKMPRLPLRPPQMLRERAEFSVGGGHDAFPEPARQVPRRIEFRHAAERRELLLASRLAVHEGKRRLEVVIDCFASDEQPHDLRRTLEDQIDAEVTHRTLNRDRLFAT